MFASQHIPRRKPVTISHIASYGTTGTGVWGTLSWSTTAAVGTGRTLFALSMNHENSTDFNVTFKIDGVTIAPLAYHEGTSYDQRGGLALYELDTPSGGTVSVSVTITGHDVRYLRLDTFSSSGYLKLQNTYTATGGSSGASVSASVDGDGYLLAVATSIRNNGTFNSDMFIGTCGLQRFASGVTGRTITISQSSTYNVSAASLSGITNVGTRYGNGYDWNHSDGAELLVAALSAA